MNGTDRPLDRAYWLHAIDTCAARGQRVLALAMRPASVEKRALTFEDIEPAFTLLGLVGIIDPPREEARKAVERLLQLQPGLRVAEARLFQIISRPQDVERWADALRKAGLPE